MLRTHTNLVRGLALGLAAVLASPETFAAPAKKSKSKNTPAVETPDAGDSNIPDAQDPDKPRIPPPMATPATPGPTAASSPPVSTTPTVTRVNKGSMEQGLELSDQADAKFDAGDYAEAARLYTKTLQMLSENDTNHITRSIVLANGVTAYEFLYATTGELDHLKKAQLLLQDYLKACQKKHGVGCDRFPETQEARGRLRNVNESIERAAPLRPKVPPEIDTAPGGKSYDLTVDLPPTPAWIAPAFVGGLVIAAGGSVLVWHAATDDAYGPIVERSFHRNFEGFETDDTGTVDTADTGVDTSGDTADTDGTDTSSSTSTVVELSPETKGKLLIGVGSFLIAAGVGVVALSVIKLAKHKRINKSRSQRLAVTPAFGRSGGGLVFTGRF